MARRPESRGKAGAAGAAAARLLENVEHQAEGRPQGVGLRRAVRRELEADSFRRDLDAAHPGIFHLRTRRRRHQTVADQHDFVDPRAANDPIARRLRELQHHRRHSLQVHEPDFERQLALRWSHHEENGARLVPVEVQSELGAVTVPEELERHEQPAIDVDRRLRERLNLGSRGDRGASGHQDEHRLADRQAVALAQRPDFEPPTEPADDRLELDQESGGCRGEGQRRRSTAHNQAAGAGSGQDDRRLGVGLGGIFLGADRAGDEQQEAGEEAEIEASFHRPRQ